MIRVRYDGLRTNMAENSMKTITREQLNDIMARLDDLREDVAGDGPIEADVMTQLVEDADLMAAVLAVLFQKVDAIEALAESVVEVVETKHADILPVSLDAVVPNEGIGYLRVGYTFGLLEAIDYLAAPETRDGPAEEPDDHA